MNRKVADWAPPEPEADRIIVRHAPKLSRDLRIEVLEVDEGLQRLADALSVIASAGVRADVAAWNMQWAFGNPNDDEDNPTT